MTISNTLLEREKKVRPFIEKHATMFGLNPNLIRALITQECRFIGDAESPTGAFGFGQFTRIGAAQVRQIAEMHDVPNNEDLTSFSKSQANDPDIGIKAICATLWWLLNKKYSGISDKTIQLEAVLTFYNAGGRAGFLVVKHKGHANAVPHIKNLPPAFQSQADHYAPQVLAWLVEWHDALGTITPVTASTKIDLSYKNVIDIIKLLGSQDENVTVEIETQGGLTEISLIVPGEYT